MNDFVWLLMRRLRAPLIVLILTYFLSVFAMVLVPGQDELGNPVRMSYVDAAYFVAIMTTTIGFGEIPYDFTNAQRLVVFFLILPNVGAWLYSTLAIITLFLDDQFRVVLDRARFTRRVRWIGEPFYLVCGFGNTGSMVARGLIKRGLQAVALDKCERTVASRTLADEFAHMPMLSCETTDIENLELAGIRSENCRGVIAATNDDHANLTIAITCKLLRPELPVYARSENQRVSRNMDSFGTDFVINPYAIFAERMYLALTSPVKYLVQDWLISVPGTDLRKKLEPPTGRWIVCGAGRFGERMLERLAEGGLPFTVVDVHPERVAQFEDAVRGRGTEAATLEEARILDDDAVGIIASTGDDIDNLSIVMTARELNPGLFVVARQEQQQYEELFEALDADLVANRSKIVARRMLAVATTPLLQTFLQHLVHAEESFAERTKARLESCLNDRAPSLWVIRLDGREAAGLRSADAAGVELHLQHLTHNSRSEQGEMLPCVCLVLRRSARTFFLPDAGERLLEGDELLFAGRSVARWEMERALQDPVLLMDFATPGPVPRTALGRWIMRRSD